MMKFSRRGLPGFLLVFPIFAMLLLMQPYRTLSFAPSINLSVVSPVNNDNRNSKELRRKSLLPVRKNQERMHKTDSRLNAIMDIVGVSPEPIHTAFAFATFGPQPFWVLMILLPKNEITKKIMGTMDVVIFFALVHFFIVSASIMQPDSTAPLLEFNDVFDPSKDSQAAFMNMVTNYPNFVAEEWPHVLTWDLFVGRWIWLDGLKRGIFTPHSVLFTNLIGPPGLLLHWITCLVTKKGFGSNEAPFDDDVDES